MLNWILKLFNMRVVPLNMGNNLASCDHCKQSVDEYYIWNEYGEDRYLCEDCNLILGTQYHNFLNPKDGNGDGTVTLFRQVK